MRVIELDRPWVESPFTVHGFLITSKEEIEKLQRSCAYVYVAASKKQVIDPTGSNLKRQAYTDTQSFQQAIPQAKSAHRQAKSVVKGFLKNIRLGQSFETSVAKKAVKQCVNCVIANQDAMLWLGLLKDVDEYTARHSLNVGLLSIILGRAEGLAPADLETVGLCGMLHDMGKSKIPLEILNKEGAFSDTEFEVMKTHTTLGFNILSEKPDLVEEIANVAHSHHERLNGKGYPRALPASSISYFSRIVAIADAYDAITSKRVYSPSKTSLEGLRILIGAKGSHFDPDLVDKFVQCIGIYPAGSVAELSSGEIAIVLPSPLERRDSPNVLIIKDRSKKSCTPRTVDLSSETAEDPSSRLKIRHLLSDDAFGIDVAKYHEMGTAAAN
jgi:putative nucleotidyltransferase with HDIG domain